MIKVLHTVLSLEVGGLENGVVNLINAMPDDMQVDVLCLRATGALAERIVHPRAQIICSESMTDHSISSSIRAHWKALHEGDYDILHTHGWTTMLAGAAAAWGFRAKTLKKRPLVINGEHGVYYDNDWRKRFAQRWLFKLIDGNLSVSADLGRRMEDAFSLPANTFFPILNGVDTARFTPDQSIRSARRLSLGFDDHHIVVGTVGRLVEVKNYPLLIQVFNRLYLEYPEIRLVLSGDGDQRNSLESLVRELNLQDAVTFTGRINTVAETIQAFDIFTLTSNMEGLPNTLLEAMASGVPAVVTDVGGSREVMPAEGGFLVPPGSPDELYDKLKYFIANAEARKSASALSLGHVQEHLSIESMANAYYEYYRRLF